MKPGRIPCLVPGCRRTMKDDGQTVEMICAKHWRAIPKRYRQRYTMLRRRYHRYQGTFSKRRQYERIWIANWKKCREHAITENFQGVPL